MKKRILFLTGTRADFGKLKSLMKAVDASENFELDIFVTGMHMHARYGHTHREIEKSGFKQFHSHINQRHGDAMDIILSKTINGLSDYVHENRPDLLIVHGDRVEALAGAIVGSLNNVLVAHIEGGELSGTVDELIRHSVTKLSHLHFVCNDEAALRLRRMGETSDSIRVIGSPDLDIMRSPDLPELEDVKQRYDINFDHYSLFMYHPVTTEVEQLPDDIEEVMAGLKASQENLIAIYPNNDHGSDIILQAITDRADNSNFAVYPSIRFECFLTLLKNARCIIGNSSAGIREAPVYGIPSINIGSRQQGRIPDCESVINTSNEQDAIANAIASMAGKRFTPEAIFGDGNSVNHFIDALHSDSLWQTSYQKQFRDDFNS